MALAFEYGINVNNRFLDLTGHEEDPDEFIATQSKVEEKSKAKGTETKTPKSAANKKNNATTPASNAVPAVNKKDTKETTGSKTNKDEQRKSGKVSFNEGGYQEGRTESARGGRGSGRRGGGAGSERPTSEGGTRGSYSSQRPPRTNRPDSQRSKNESGSFDQPSENFGEGSGEGHSGEFRGRGGRGRGSRGRGIFEVRRGGGRGRGPRGGRGAYSGSRPDGDNQFQSSGFDQEPGTFEQHPDGNFEVARPKSARYANQGGADSGQHVDATADNQIIVPNSGRGGFRPRTFRSNRNYTGERGHDSNREDVTQDERRRYRHQHDRERRNEVTGVKAVEKRNGGGANNWGDQLENPDETVAAEETEEASGNNEKTTSTAWADRVDADEKQKASEEEKQRILEEERKQMTLEEYRRQQEEKKKSAQEKLPTLKPRTAGEGEDPKAWKKYEQVYRKKNEDGETEEDEQEGQESEEDDEQEEESGSKKRILTIPLKFKDDPDTRRGSFRGSGRPRGGENRRQRDYDSNDQRSGPPEKSGDQKSEGRPQSSNYGSGRGASRGSNNVRNEYYRRPQNTSRGGHGQSAGGHGPQLNLNNPDEFPSLAKQS